MPVRARLAEAERFVEPLRGRHRRQRVEEHPLVPALTAGGDHRFREPAPEARAARCRPHVEPLHLARALVDAAQRDASALREQHDWSRTRAGRRSPTRNPGTTGRRRASPRTREQAAPILRLGGLGSTITSTSSRSASSGPARRRAPLRERDGEVLDRGPVGSNTVISSSAARPPAEPVARRRAASHLHACGPVSTACASSPFWLRLLPSTSQRIRARANSSTATLRLSRAFRAHRLACSPGRRDPRGSGDLVARRHRHEDVRGQRLLLRSGSPTREPRSGPPRLGSGRRPTERPARRARERSRGRLPVHARTDHRRSLCIRPPENLGRGHRGGARCGARSQPQRRAPPAARRSTRPRGARDRSRSEAHARGPRGRRSPT